MEEIRIRVEPADATPTPDDLAALEALRRQLASQLPDADVALDVQERVPGSLGLVFPPDEVIVEWALKGAVGGAAGWAMKAVLDATKAWASERWKGRRARVIDDAGRSTTVDPESSYG